MQRVLNDSITRHPERDGKKVDGDHALWSAMPPFRFTFAPLAHSALALQSGLALLALFGFSLLLSALGLRRLRSGSVR
jgi:ABC-2 type transport system permease protein